MNRQVKALLLSVFIHAIIASIIYFLFFYADKIEPIEKISLGSLNIKEKESPAPLSSFDSTLSTDSTLSAQEQPLSEIPKDPTPSIQETKPKKQTPPKTQQKQQKEIIAPKKQEHSGTLNAHSPSLPSFYSLMNQELESELKKLYGTDFYSLSEEDKKYLDENYRLIYEITQRNLKYPYEAGRLRLEGVNRIEFYLHPNGNISDLKLVSSSGYQILDKNSLHTINISYKDYPYPQHRLKIIFLIHYRIY